MPRVIPALVIGLDMVTGGSFGSRSGHGIRSLNFAFLAGSFGGLSVLRVGTGLQKKERFALPEFEYPALEAIFVSIEGFRDSRATVCYPVEFMDFSRLQRFSQFRIVPAHSSALRTGMLKALIGPKDGLLVDELHRATINYQNLRLIDLAMHRIMDKARQ